MNYELKEMSDDELTELEVAIRQERQDRKYPVNQYPLAWGSKNNIQRLEVANAI
tara:strand:- start:1181 stop:1342 length:162 start_codon:yes stop_codon:yes gene_type:complete